MEKRVIVKINGKNLHLVLFKKYKDWEALTEANDSLWDICLEDFLTNAIEINEDIWYWFIDGRCYETEEDVE